MKTTLRTRLLVAIVCTITIALCATQYVQYRMIRRQLYAEFDQHLEAKARALAVMIEQDRDVIDVEFQNNPMQEFARGIRPEYYQVWHEDGRVLAKSRQLNADDLIPLTGDLVVPLVSDIVLPDGRAGRAAGIRFQPHVEGESLNHATVSQAGNDVRDFEDNDVSDQDAVDFSGRVYVTLVVARDTQDVEASLAQLAWLLVLTGLAAGTVIPVVLAWLVTHNLKPLQTLAGQIGDVDEQTLDQRFAITDAPGELQPVVTRLNALMLRLEGAFLREKTFTADVAHELRTPLAGIRSTLEVGLSRHRDSDSYRNSMERCLRISDETETIISTLLSLSRLDAGQATLDNDIVDLDRLLRRTWLPFATRAEQNHVDVHWTADPRCLLKTDPGKLQVVLSNMFDNATSYVDDGGEIQLQAHCERKSLLIQVRNSGCQLTAQQLTHVFDRFWRADAARSATGSHSGLGLALTRRIVEFLSGTIQADVRDGWFSVTVRLPAENVEFVEVSGDTESVSGDREPACLTAGIGPHDGD